MKTGKLAVSVLVATVFFFLTDWLWYGMLMKPDTPMPGMRTEPLMVHLVLGMLIYCFAFVSIFSKMVGGGTPVNEGARFGMWAWLLAWLPMAFIWYALVDYITLQDSLIEAVFRLVQMAIMGILVAYLAGFGGARGKDATGGDG